VIFPNNKKLYIKGLNQNAKSLVLTNMLGQRVKTFTTLNTNSLENGLYIGDLSSGVYLVNLVTENNLKLSQKVILN